MENVRPLEFPRIIDPTRWGEVARLKICHE